MLEIQSFWGQPEEGSVWQTFLSEVKWLGESRCTSGTPCEEFQCYA